MQKLNKLLVPLYIVFLILSFFYVRSVLKGVPVSTAGTLEEENPEVKNITVSLTVKAPAYTKIYTQQSKSVDSASDLLLKIKENNADFSFDRTAYSYGSEIDHVNNIKSTETMRWKMLDGDTDITLKMDDTNLMDGKNYMLVYEKASR